MVGGRDTLPWSTVKFSVTCMSNFLSSFFLPPIIYLLIFYFVPILLPNPFPLFFILFLLFGKNEFEEALGEGQHDRHGGIRCSRYSLSYCSWPPERIQWNLLVCWCGFMPLEVWNKDKIVGLLLKEKKSRKRKKKKGKRKKEKKKNYMAQPLKNQSLFSRDLEDTGDGAFRVGVIRFSFPVIQHAMAYLIRHSKKIIIKCGKNDTDTAARHGKIRTPTNQASICHTIIAEKSIENTVKI